jgi:hypothetical protein
MPDAFVVAPASRPAPLNVVGEQITVLAAGSRTGGYEIFRQAAQKAADLADTESDAPGRRDRRVEPIRSGGPPHCVKFGNWEAPEDLK